MRKFWTLALVAALAVAGVGCDYQPAQLVAFDPPLPPAGQPQPERVVLFGDSLSAMAAVPAKAAAGARRNDWSWSYNAFGGTRMQHWGDAMTVAAELPADVVVVALMTNNVSNEAINTGELETNLRAGFDRLVGVECVVFLTLNETGGNLRGFPYDQRTRWANDRVSQLVVDGTYPNLRIYDWNTRAAGRTDWLTSDEVHHTDAGNLEYADALIDAAELCSP